jgi:RNA polymerase sigma-70 factor (ECF subfamily)
VVDPEGLAGFAAGDPDAVRAVYGAYGRLVYAVAYKVLGDRGLAEEATQQAFVQAWRASGSYDPAREMGSWLATIARRAAIDVYRREARRSHGSLEDADPADPALITLPPSVERVYDVWEVRRAIGTLDPDDAELVRLQHFDGLTQAQIAERLGVPVGTVKSRSFRVHRRLAGMLGHLRDNPDRTSTAGRRRE